MAGRQPFRISEGLYLMYMPTRLLLLLTLSGTTFCGLAAAEKHKRVKYEPTWESLDQHETPKWLMDAKFGLFIYAPPPSDRQWMAWQRRVGETPRSWERADSMDKVDWNVDHVLDEVQAAGARYVVVAGDERSYFLLWPSEFADIEGSKFTTLGPNQKDWLGEFSRKARKRGLRFGIYRNYLHPGKNPYFLKTMAEMIDRYQPDTLWLDEDAHKHSADDLRSRELAAYYYNHSKKQNEVALEDSLGHYKHKLDTFGKRLLHGDWFRKEISPPHDDIADGYFVRYEPMYRWRTRTPRGHEHSGGMVNNLIEWLVDSVAKNGNLELATHAGPQHVADLQRRTLQQIGLWLEVNGEAIFETRPWHDGVPQAVSKEGFHARFTTKDDSLYVTLFDWPHPQATFARLATQEGTTIQMLGVPGAVRWEQSPAGLVLGRPHGGGAEGDVTEIPCDHAFCYKITPRPAWKKK